MKKIKNVFCSERGITLIALVITIIILLILAGISIIQLTGNGLFGKAKQSKSVHIKEEMKERLILAISDLQVEKKGDATLNDITEDWTSGNLKDYDGVLISSSSENQKKIKMKKNGITQIFIIDSNLNIIEDKSTEFSYEVVSREGNNVNIQITLRDETNGINRIELPNIDAIICNGNKEEIQINYVAQIGVEYKVKIILENGEEKEEIILVNPEIEITEPIIGINTTATESVEDNSQTRGTKLYINFSATLEGQACIIQPTVPYEITKNGTYKFNVKGVYKEKTITKEVEVEVNKYKEMGGFVQYDAGDWTQEEIEELRSLSLYELNEEHKELSTDFKLDYPNKKEAVNFTFGGFSYKGSLDENIQGVITSKNKSVKPQDGHGEPIAEGWRILESEMKDGKVYISKLIHAGCPENFTWRAVNNDDAYRALYLLTGKETSGYGKTLVSGKEINIRNWDMYKDKKLDNEGYIKSVSIVTDNEMSKLEDKSDLFNIGSTYIVGNSGCHYTLYTVLYNGYYAKDTYDAYYNGGTYGVRPVVELNDGVYIKEGEGTETNPYILCKE